MHPVAEEIARDIAAGRLGPGARLASVRDTALAIGVAAATVARAHRELAAVGLIIPRDRARARVADGAPARARRLLSGARPLRLAGSDDPALDALLAWVGDDAEPVLGPRGSVHGLGHLARGSADAAVIHLRHAADGRYNDPFVRHLLPGEGVVIVHLWRRELGLVVAPGTTGPADLDGRRLAWRAAGTGSRLAMERLLHAYGSDPLPERGPPADSHLAVAATVASGAADAGVAVRAAATAVQAAFVPLETEPFELAVRADALAALRPLLDALGEGGLRLRIEALGGYDLANAGEERIAA